MIKKKILIFGAGQFGNYVLDIIRKDKSYDFIGFIDKKKKRNVIGNDEYFEKNIAKKINNLNVFIAIYESDLRKKFINYIINNNLVSPNIIDITAKISKSTKIGKGNIIGTNSVISNNVNIGNYNLIGTSVNLLHNSKIYNNVIISGAANIGANVKIHDNVFVGVGSTISSGNIIIKKNSFICAGSVVLNNISENSKVIGNPARKII